MPTTAHPDISWLNEKQHHGSEVPYQFDGTFPFRTYVDTEVYDVQLDVSCPRCGNDLLKVDEDWGSNMCWGTVGVKNYCDECGAKIEVPRDDACYMTMDGGLRVPDGWVFVHGKERNSFVWTGVVETSFEQDECSGDAENDIEDGKGRR